MSKALNHNLNLLMLEARLNAEELSRRIGLPASTIKKIRNNVDANPTLSTLAPLAQYFALSISELVGEAPFPKNRIKGTYKPNLETLIHLPIITWEDAIHWPDVKTTTNTTISSEHHYSKNSFALIIQEDDWENLAKDTALLIDPTIKPFHRDFIITHKQGIPLPSIKQLLIDEGHVYLKPVTTGYQITTYTPDYRMLGVVVEYKKYLKKAHTYES